VQKSVINDAGIAFSATPNTRAKSKTDHVVMMLVARLARRPRHDALPLARVPEAIRQDDLVRTLRVLDHDLKQRFRIKRPRILVAASTP